MYQETIINCNQKPFPVFRFFVNFSSGEQRLTQVRFLSNRSNYWALFPKLARAIELKSKIIRAENNDSPTPPPLVKLPPLVSQNFARVDPKPQIDGNHYSTKTLNLMV